MGQPRWSYASVFAADAASVADAREFVRGQLIRHGLEFLVDDACLVVSELATNATVHARTPFTVTVSGGGRSVRLTVRDGAAESPRQVAANLMDTGGRGLRIVEQLSSGWGVTDADAVGHAKCVWASFDATHTRWLREPG